MTPNWEESSLCRRSPHLLFSLQLPTIIADNAGYDSADLVAQLRAAHQENRTTCGLSECGLPVHRGGV